MVSSTRWQARQILFALACLCIAAGLIALGVDTALTPRFCSARDVERHSGINLAEYGVAQGVPFECRIRGSRMYLAFRVDAAQLERLKLQTRIQVGAATPEDSKLTLGAFPGEIRVGKTRIFSNQKSLSLEKKWVGKSSGWFNQDRVSLLTDAQGTTAYLILKRTRLWWLP